MNINAPSNEYNDLIRSNKLDPQDKESLSYNGCQARAILSPELVLTQG